MVFLCKLLKSILKFFTNLTVIAQIIFLISIFLLASYTLFSLVGSHLFDFAAPLSDGVHLLVSTYSGKPVEMNGQSDGTVFFACIVMGFLVYFLSKFKKFLDRCFIELKDFQYKCEIKIEDKANEIMQYETNKQIMEYNSAGILIKLSAKDMSIDSFYLNKNSFSDFEETKKTKEHELFKELHKQLSYIKECTFSKAGNNLLINLQDLNKIDKLLNYLDVTLQKISKDLKKERWELTSYIAIEAYNNKYPLKSCYPALQGLVNLRIPNSIVCFENFCSRYYMVENNLYEAYLKGTYMLPVEKNVWALVKKR